MNIQTEKLYYKNAYLKEFSAQVIDCIDLKKKKNFGVVLDKTVFYPEGGGQPGDRGKLNGIEVLDTQIDNEKIIHITKKPIEVGIKVSGKINWDKRYDLMQFHTGQHLISGAFVDLYDAETTSVHVSDNTLSIDLRLDNFSWKKAEIIEKKMNEMIYKNIPVKINWYSDLEEVKKFSIRKLPKKKSKMGYRIVEIENFDFSACGGMHLKSIGELGIIKIHKWRNIKDGIELEFLCGKRALKDYFIKNKTIIEIAQMFDSPEEDVLRLAKKSFEEKIELQKKVEQLEQGMLEFEAPELIKDGKKINNITIINKIFSGRSPTDLFNLVNKLIENENIIALIGNKGINEDKCNLIFGRSQNLKRDDLNMNAYIRDACKIINGGGGGRPYLAQGGGKGKNIEKAVEISLEKIETVIDNLF